jgi:hypothetical protein
MCLRADAKVRPAWTKDSVGVNDLGLEVQWWRFVGAKSRMILERAREAATRERKDHSAASRNQRNVTTDFTDFTDKKDGFPIRDICEIRGQKSSPF